MNLAPQYAAMQLSVAVRNDDDTVSTHTINLADDNAGTLRTVLANVEEFLRLAGFTYVAAIAAEYDDGTIVFSDED